MNILNYNINYRYNKLLYKYMKNSKFVINKLAKLFEQGLVSSKDLGNELMNILKSKRDEMVFKMKLTSKDEFEVLSKRVDNLEKKIDQLQKIKKKNSKSAKKS
tara:strand:+ start:790 stop:1098 length:309 start_codon:yes stop_codon:yes gene_type:complete